MLTPGAGVSADAVAAHRLKDVLAQVRDHGWVHHIPGLMVLSNYALQRGWNPAAVTDWFHRCFVDGYDWVMVANVVGMSQHADGGLMATKPYAAGGAADEQALAGLRRLGDLDDVVEQQRRLGGRAP